MRRSLAILQLFLIVSWRLAQNPARYRSLYSPSYTDGTAFDFSVTNTGNLQVNATDDSMVDRRPVALNTGEVKRCLAGGASRMESRSCQLGARIPLAAFDAPIHSLTIHHLHAPRKTRFPTATWAFGAWQGSYGRTRTICVDSDDH